MMVGMLKDRKSFDGMPWHTGSTHVCMYNVLVHMYICIIFADVFFEVDV